MERKKFNEVTWIPAVLFGKAVLVTESRIDRRNVPGFPYVYELRHDDNGDWTTPVEICNSVMVNFCMTLISNEPLPTKLKYNYVFIEDGDFLMDEGSFVNMSEKSMEDLSNMQTSKFRMPEDRVHAYRTRLFISQPFTGMNENMIRKQRRLLHAVYAAYTGRKIADVDLINQFDPNDPEEKFHGIVGSQPYNQYTFCRSIGMMGDADEVLIFGNWARSRGCTIEREICNKFDIPIVYQEDLIKFCEENPDYDDHFKFLWPEEFFSFHEIYPITIKSHQYATVCSGYQFQAWACAEDEIPEGAYDDTDYEKCKEIWDNHILAPCEGDKIPIFGLGNSPDEAYMNLYDKAISDIGFIDEDDEIAEDIKEDINEEED